MSDSIEAYSNLSRAEALDGSAITHPELRRMHEAMLDYLVVFPVKHLMYDGRIGQGQLVAHEAMQSVFEDIFEGMLDLGYPIEHVVPGVEYGWNDELMMDDNATGCYRPEQIGDLDDEWYLSEHFRGSGFDLNSLDNPEVTSTNQVRPARAFGRVPYAPALLSERPKVIELFDEHDMEYGGAWKTPGHKDYYAGPQIPIDRHHFELRPRQIGRLAVPAGWWPEMPSRG